MGIAHHHALRDQPVGSNSILEYRRCHILAARGDNQLFLAPGDSDESFVVNFTDIARVEPAVQVESFGGCRLVVPVAREYLSAREHQLTIACDFHTCPGQWLPYAAYAQRMGAVDRGSGTGFG